MAAKQACLLILIELNHRHAKWADGSVLPSKMIWTRQMSPLKRIYDGQAEFNGDESAERELLETHTSNENGGD